MNSSIAHLSVKTILVLYLVAEMDGKIVGHIMFTRAKVEENTVLALAPLSVLPKYQRRGIGVSLINAGHKIAKELGYVYSIVFNGIRRPVLICKWTVRFCLAAIFYQHW